MFFCRVLNPNKHQDVGVSTSVLFLHKSEKVLKHFEVKKTNDLSKLILNFEVCL